MDTAAGCFVPFGFFGVPGYLELLIILIIIAVPVIACAAVVVAVIVAVRRPRQYYGPRARPPNSPFDPSRTNNQPPEAELITPDVFTEAQEKNSRRNNLTK